MLISSFCFSDIELKNEVENEATHKNQICSISGQNGDLIESEYFDDFFVCIISLFKKDPASRIPLIKAIQSRWNIFTKDNYGEMFLNELCYRKNLGITSSDLVSFENHIQAGINLWGKIREELTGKNRYFVNPEEIRSRGLIEIPDGCKILKKGEILYRSRITDEGKVKMKPSEMKCPPSNKTRAGRANPVGIPYLYLCKDIKTTYYEVRAGFLDNISVGRFIIKRDLNIVDFDYQLNPYPVFIDGGEDELKKQVIKYEFLKDVRNDLSKPLKRYDTELEYVPTQWISEYCKIEGADGISFASSLDGEGTNYVLFNQNDAKCTQVTPHTIHKIEITD